VKIAKIFPGNAIAGGSFSYATLPGANFAGEAYSLTASGSYDTNDHTGSWTSTASFSNLEIAWESFGSLGPSASDSSKLAVMFTTSFPFCLDCRTEIATKSETPTFLGIDFNTQTFVYDRDGNVINTHPDFGTCQSGAIKDCFKWGTDWDELFAPLEVAAAGDVNPDGNGTFTVNFSPVPEPSSFALIAGAIASLVGIGWVCRQKT